MKKKVMTAVIFLLMVPSLAAFAQEYPKYEFFGGFSWYARIGSSNWMGWNASGAKNINQYLSIAVDASELNSSPSENINGVLYKIDTRRYIFLAGPQVMSRDTNSRVEPFLHLLFGAAHYSIDYVGIQNGTVMASVSESRNEFAMTLGGGFDYRIKKQGPVAVRLIQINYMGVRSSGFWMKGWRFSSGLVLKLGKQSD